MKIPKSIDDKAEHLSVTVERRLPPEFMIGFIQRHFEGALENSISATNKIESITRAFVRYEIDTLNSTKGSRQERRRSLKKIENSSKRLLNTLDELPLDIYQGLEFFTFEQKTLRVLKTKGTNSVPIEFGDVLVERLISDVSMLLRASREQIEADEQTKVRVGLRDTPLNRLVHNLAELWPYQMQAIGVYYSSENESYSGPLYAMIAELFGKYFEASAYQSEQALGKRIHRVVYLMRGKDIG